jgi:hypothetical protein
VITSVTISLIAVSPINSWCSMLSTTSLLTYYPILSSRGLISLRLRNLNLFDFGIRPYNSPFIHAETKCLHIALSLKKSTRTKFSFSINIYNITINLFIFISL